MKPLDMKEIAIIDAFPAYDYKKVILNVGCGEGKLDYHLALMDYRVYATDIEESEMWQEANNLTFHQSSIFDLSSFPLSLAPVVICSQVLEHIKDYKLALTNLIALTGVRLIITVPHKRSFINPNHINFWDDYLAGHTFKDIKEFVTLCQPYSTAISKIRTKPEDRNGNHDYLIIVDKRQNLIDPKWVMGSR
jgi:ubiquinone/menaquinone biosynthesis C-methylase UbiE